MTEIGHTTLAEMRDLAKKGDVAYDRAADLADQMLDNLDACEYGELLGALALASMRTLKELVLMAEATPEPAPTNEA
jgi:hypothetical protein